MERALVMTGIGGQGVQLAATVLATAALAEGREVQLFGSYGGMMRGGATEAALVVADGPINAPPTVGAAWAAVVMHHEHAGHALSCLRPGSLAFVNSSVMEAELDRDSWHVVEVPATDLAVDAGHVMTASMVMLGAFAASTGIVATAALFDAVEASLPPYRSQHVALNRRALELGAGAVDPCTAPAWEGALAR